MTDKISPQAALDAIATLGNLWSGTAELVQALHQADADKWFVYLIVCLHFVYKFAVLYVVYRLGKMWLEKHKQMEYREKMQLLELEIKLEKIKGKSDARTH
ncbi:MAG: hypothetical protein AB7D03_03740 [Thiomicrospira sp.]